MAKILLDVSLKTPVEDIERLKSSLRSVANVVTQIKPDPQLTAQLNAITNFYKTISAAAPKATNALKKQTQAEKSATAETKKKTSADKLSAAETKKKATEETKESTIKAKQTAEENKNAESVKKNTRAVKDSTAENQKHEQGVLSMAGKFLKWQAAATLVMAPLNLIKSALRDINETLVETEKRVVALERVLPENSASGIEIATRLYRLAEDYGQTFESVSEIAENFAKAGYDWKDTLKMTEAAVIGVNVAELDASEASEGMIAIMQQFHLEASDLLSVVEKIDKVGDRFPVSSQKIYAALQRMGSTAANSNLSLEKSIGIVTALSEATGRGGENIGTALNSLINYTKKEKALEAFASLSENVAATVEAFKLGTKDILDVWKAVSVVIKNADERQTEILNNLTSDEEVKELSETLKGELGDIYETEENIFGQVGVFRRNYMIAAINNMETYAKATQEAMTAEGYAIRENEKYMGTYEAKVNRLKSKWQEVANDEQGLLGVKKGLVDVGTELLTVMQATGGVRTAFLSLGTVAGFIFGGPIGGGIGLLLTGISAIAGGIKNARKEALLLANETYEKARENTETLEALRAEYIAITDSEKSEAEKAKELYEWKQKLVEQYGFEKEALAGVNTERQTGIDLLDDEIASQQAKWLNDNEKTIKDAKNRLNELNSGFAFDIYETGWIDDLTAYFDTLENVSISFVDAGDYQYFLAQAENIELAYKEIGDKIEKLREKKVGLHGITSEEKYQLEALEDLYKQLAPLYEDDYSLVQKSVDARAKLIFYQNREALATTKNVKEFVRLRDSILNASGVTDDLRVAISNLVDSAFGNMVTDAAILNGTLFDTSNKLDDVYRNALLASEGLVKAAIAAQEADLILAKGKLGDAENIGAGLDARIARKEIAEIEDRIAQLNEILKISENGGGSNNGNNNAGKNGDGKGDKNDAELERLKSIVNLRNAELTLMEKQGASAEEQAAKISEIQAAMHDEAEHLRKIGGREEDILKLQADWYSFEEKKKKIVEDAQKAEIDRLKSVVSLRNAELTLMEKQGASAEEQAAKIGEIQAALHAEAEYMREVGADTEDILKLQTDWLEKEEKKKKILEEQKKTHIEILKTIQEEETASIQSQIDALQNARDIEQDQLEIEKKKQAVLKAQLDLLEAMEARNVRVYNEKSGQWEWTANAKNVQSARDALKNVQDSYDSALSNKAYNDRIAALENQKDAAAKKFERVINGDATDAEIVEMMKSNSQKAGSAAFNSDTLHKENLALAGVLGAKYDDASGAYYKDGKRLYDSGGLLLGAGGIKATSRPEAVLDPELTAKLMHPTPTARYSDIVKGLGLLLGNGRETAGNAGVVRGNVMSDNRNQSDNRSYYLNGVQIPSGAEKMNISDLFRLMPLVQ